MTESEKQTPFIVGKQFCPKCSPYTWGNQNVQILPPIQQCTECGYTWKTGSPDDGSSRNKELVINDYPNAIAVFENGRWIIMSKEVELTWVTSKCQSETEAWDNACDAIRGRLKSLKQMHSES